MRTLWLWAAGFALLIDQTAVAGIWLMCAAFSS